MTALGKTLVLLTFTLSLAMATWAFGVWSSRIDFSDTKAKGSETAGEYEKRRVVIETLGKELPPAEASWKDARKNLADEETWLVDDRVWYHDQLDYLRTKATVNDPVRQVVYAKQDDEKPGARKGQILLDLPRPPGTGRPVLEVVKDRLGNPLPSLRVLVEEEGRWLASLEEVQKRHQKQIQEAVALTERLIGVPPGKKGLQQQLAEEHRKQDDVIAEKALMEPLLINTTVDAALVQKRHRALEARIEELKKIGVAVRDR